MISGNRVLFPDNLIASRIVLIPWRLKTNYLDTSRCTPINGLAGAAMLNIEILVIIHTRLGLEYRFGAFVASSFRVEEQSKNALDDRLVDSLLLVGIVPEPFAKAMLSSFRLIIANDVNYHLLQIIK